MELDFLFNFSEAYPFLRKPLNKYIEKKYNSIKDGKNIYNLFLSVVNSSREELTMMDAIRKIYLNQVLTQKEELMSIRLPDCTIKDIEDSHIGCDFFVPHQSIKCYTYPMYVVCNPANFNIPERALVVPNSWFSVEKEYNHVRVTPYVSNSRILLSTQHQHGYLKDYYNFIIPLKSIDKK